MYGAEPEYSGHKVPENSSLAFTIGGFHAEGDTTPADIASTTELIMPSALIQHVGLQREFLPHRVRLDLAVRGADGQALPVGLPAVQGGRWVCGDSNPFAPLAGIP